MSKEPIKRTTSRTVELLLAEIETLTRKGEELCDAYGKSLIQIHDLTAKVKRYETALEFYANPDTYGQDDVSRTTGNKQFDIVCFDSDRDFKKGIDMSGKRARAALNQGEGK